jgi:hypothetical protein
MVLADVGVPVILPFVLRLKPVPVKDPEVSVQVSAPVPPIAATVVE